MRSQGNGHRDDGPVAWHALNVKGAAQSLRALAHPQQAQRVQASDFIRLNTSPIIVNLKRQRLRRGGHAKRNLDMLRAGVARDVRQRFLKDAEQCQGVDALLESGKRQPLTLISALPGFGKTTVMTEWIQSQDKLHIAWLSLEEADNQFPAPANEIDQRGYIFWFDMVFCATRVTSQRIDDFYQGGRCIDQGKAPITQRA